MSPPQSRVTRPTRTCAGGFLLRDDAPYTEPMEAPELLPFDTVPVPTPAHGPRVLELVPAPDPWAVTLQLAHLPGLLFLDSAEKHARRGRYSYVAADTTIELQPSPREGTTRNPESLTRLRNRLGNTPIDPVPELPPFQGGLAGLFGYELGRELETLPQTQFDEFPCPAWAVGFYDWVIAFDHEQNRAWLVSTGREPGTRSSGDLNRALDRTQWVLQQLRTPRRSRMDNLAPRMAASTRSGLCPQYPLPGYPQVTSNFNRLQFERAVQRAVEYIHAGDCFQVNIAQRLLAPLRERPLDLYGRLRQRNPAPFGAYFDLGATQILSASPERFLQLSARGEVETRPIKGTRPRGATPAADAALIEDLANSGKDRAENVMIVDLLRNDLGKVCEYGSVRVPQVCELESFRYVHHLVSEVRGQLRPGLTALDLLAAAFPGGSVTGAPKVRAMEIITELEPTARGAYCGSMGWIGFNGAMDTNILIRTFTASQGWLQFPVGGGIVAESDPRREYEETLHKAAGLLHSLQLDEPATSPELLPAEPQTAE